MSVKLNLHKNVKSFTSEINEGFPNSWIFNVPVDLSFSQKFPDNSEKEANLSDLKTNLSDNISQNYLPGDLINSMSNLSSISLDEELLLDTQNKNGNIQDEILTRSSRSTSRFYSSPLNQNNEDNNSSEESSKENLTNEEKAIKESKFLSYKEDRGKVEEKIYYSPQNIDALNLNDSLLNGKMNNGCSLQPVQNYNINIYNPNINYVNICYPSVNYPFSSFPQDNNQILKDICFIFNEEELAGQFPMNFYYDNSKNIIKNIAFNNENNINSLINSSINNNNLGDNFPAYFSETNVDQNLIFNDTVKTNDINNSNLNENQNNENKNTKINNVPKAKKNKKRKKKKIDDEYTVEMFGRRGWICEGCNNFNYESRKKCNRCKIPKKPLKKTVIMDNKGNKIVDHIMNANHKEDWNCYNCGNVNYAFRLNCNRCQKKRDDDYDKTNNKINKLDN